MSPTILRKGSYRFFFFSTDREEPKHIHVTNGDKYAKYWVEPVALARNKGFSGHELTEIHKIVESNKKLIKEKWDEFFKS